MSLFIAVNASHALFKPCRVPRDIIVDHQPAELQVDAFTCCVCCNKEPSTISINRAAEEFHLFIALTEAGVFVGMSAHPTMYLSYLPRIAYSLQAADKELKGIPVLGE